MISDESIKKISSIFCGDVPGYYSYKSGPNLVSFFNLYFKCADTYKSGFPSRWAYVHDKIVGMLHTGNAEAFFTRILDRRFLMQDLNKTEVEATEASGIILNEFNKILRQDGYKIIRVVNEFKIIQIDEDLVLVGSGGFANVYKQHSTGMIVKRLKDDFLADDGVRSRFKREFNITKSLENIPGIIKVYSFDEGNYSYTMEEAEQTLERFVSDNKLTDKNRLTLIYQLLNVMSEVHKRDVVHRDISPNNIFIISGNVKLADFGLGKDLNVLTSHQTIHTNSFGQYYYCAPEQFMLLKDADKKSDVYSIGRVINFIMTGKPESSNHAYRSVTEKATSTDAVYRYADAGQLFVFFKKAVGYNNAKEQIERIMKNIRDRIFDDETENFIYNLNSESMSEYVRNRQYGFLNALLFFMSINADHEQHIIQSIDKSFKDVCGRSFESYDSFALFAENVIRGEYSFVTKEIAVNILRFVANYVGRYNAQRIVKNLLSEDVIDPMIKEILQS